jgi:hypothetical protein
MVRWARTSDGARKNERVGEVWRSHENIATELGKSSRQVDRNLAKLEAVGLMSHRKRDGRKSNTYFFLFHASFEGAPASVQTGDDVGFEQTPVTGQTGREAPPCPVVSRRPRPVESDLSGRPRPTNQEVFNQQVESSSIEQNGHVGSAPTTRTTTSESSNPNPMPRTWRASEVYQAREDMRRHAARHFPAEMLPDEALARKVLEHMEGPKDVDLWLLDLTSRMVLPRGWGFYLADAATWPARRRDVLDQVEAERIAREQRDAENARRIAREQRDAENARLFAPPPQSDETQQVTAPAAAPRCKECSGSGIRQAADDQQLYQWCVCPAGPRKRAEAPGAVDQANALVLALRQKFASPAREGESSLSEARSATSR